MLKQPKYSSYYQVIAGADIGGQAGVAYIRGYNEINLLPKQGWVKDWETKHFTLKNGEYTDYLPANIGCRLCSKKMRDILERYKSEKDVLQWLDAEVESITGEKRSYFILHFPVLLENVLDKKKSKYVRNILTKQVISPEACVGHEVFSYLEVSALSYIVSQKVKQELKNADCRGLIYIQMTPQRKSHIPKIIKRLYSLFYIKREQTDEKTIVRSKKNINWNQIEKMNLPPDFLDFIDHRKQLSYDEKKCTVGRIELTSMDSLIFGRIFVESKDENYKKGYYTIPVVDLIAECKDFDPWGILVWLPDNQFFGTWDCDHRKLRVFPNAVWGDIVAEPTKYLNALWNPQEVENKIFEPDDKYIFTEEA